MINTTNLSDYVYTTAYYNTSMWHQSTEQNAISKTTPCLCRS